jgi:hypothetical protein
MLQLTSYVYGIAIEIKVLACLCLLFRLLGVPSAILTPDFDTTFTSTEPLPRPLIIDKMCSRTLILSFLLNHVDTS